VTKERSSAFWEEKIGSPSVATQGDTNPSDATVSLCSLQNSRDNKQKLTNFHLVH